MNRTAFLQYIFRQKISRERVGFTFIFVLTFIIKKNISNIELSIYDLKRSQILIR